MTKTELTNAIANGANITKAQAADALKATLDAISTALANGEKVALIGFGTFSVVTKAARKGFNPRTNEPVMIAESKAVKFKAGSELADKIRTK